MWFFSPVLSQLGLNVPSTSSDLKLEMVGGFSWKEIQGLHWTYFTSLRGAEKTLFPETSGKSIYAVSMAGQDLLDKSDVTVKTLCIPRTFSDLDTKTLDPWKDHPYDYVLIFLNVKFPLLSTMICQFLSPHFCSLSMAKKGRNTSDTTTLIKAPDDQQELHKYIWHLEHFFIHC